jgi:hypothetical protein
VGVAITRTDSALSSAADLIDQGDGALAAKPLTAARKYLIRSYNGARFLIAHPPPVAAQEARVSAVKFTAQAHRLVQASRKDSKARSRWIRAHASQQEVVGPVFADTPTAVFNVLASQFAAATAAIGMYPDTTGALQDKERLVLTTSIVLRNRIVKAVQAAEPPTAAEASVKAHASQDEGAATFAPVMPGLTVLIDAEIQQMQATIASLPAASQADLQSAIAADQKLEALVNSLWPPAPAD